MSRYVASFLARKPNGDLFLGVTDVEAIDEEEARESMIKLAKKLYGSTSHITIGPICDLEGRIVYPSEKEDGEIYS